MGPERRWQRLHQGTRSRPHRSPAATRPRSAPVPDFPGPPLAGLPAFVSMPPLPDLMIPPRGGVGEGLRDLSADLVPSPRLREGILPGQPRPQVPAALCIPVEDMRLGPRGNQVGDVWGTVAIMHQHPCRADEERVVRATVSVYTTARPTLYRTPSTVTSRPLASRSQSPTCRSPACTQPASFRTARRPRRRDGRR